VSEEKKEYTAQEVAVAILDKAKELTKEALEKSMSVEQVVTKIKGPAKLNEVLPNVPSEKRGEVLKELRSMDKASPENQTSAQMAEVKIPQPKPPEAQAKVIAKQPLQLKKFMDKCMAKKMAKKEGK